MSGSVELINEERIFKVVLDGKIYHLKEIHDHIENISWCEFYDENNRPIEDDYLKERLFEMVFSAFK